MEPALEDVEPTPFAEPTFWPEWKPFTRGRYALTYDPSYTAPATTTSETETETTTSTEAKPPPDGTTP